MSTIIIYHSKYGHTEQYAKWISEDLASPMMALDEANSADLSQYDTLILGAPLYAGGFKGKEVLEKYQDKQLYIFTVGMAAPEETDYQPVLEKSLSPELIERVKVYHLRAGMDFKRLSIIHKLMMWMMKKMHFDKVPEAERSADYTYMMENYYGVSDFFDKTTIEPLVTEVQSK